MAKADQRKGILSSNHQPLSGYCCLKFQERKTEASHEPSIAAKHCHERKERCCFCTKDTIQIPKKQEDPRTEAATVTQNFTISQIPSLSNGKLAGSLTNTCVMPGAFIQREDG